MNVTLLVEGGGDNEALRTECRKGFRLFLEKAGLNGRMPRIKARGSRRAAYDDFVTASGAATSGDFIVLLVDSETPVNMDPTTGKPMSAWAHLHAADGWTKPSGAVEDNAHLMVQCMETWFLADIACLKEYFDGGFKEAKLKTHVNLEAVIKTTVFQELADATSALKSKARYDDRSKGTHSFEILARIDPAKVRKSCPHADRLLQTLDARC